MSKEDMSTEEQTTPVADNAEVEKQEQENIEERTEESIESADEATKEGEEQAKEGQKANKGDWRLKRINTLTGRNKQLEEEVATAKANQEALLTKVAALQSGQKANPAEAEAEVKNLAAEMAKDIAAREIAIAQYNRDCDRVFNKGVKDYPEFKECVENLNGSFGERWTNAIPIIVDALDDAHKIIHHLGTNLDEANRILTLSPARQIAELTKLEVVLAKPESKQISKVPAPIKPVEGRVAAPINLANTNDTEAWIKARYKQIEAAKATKKR